ncbi:hypothetical protein FB451DRAFT_1179098 [Mycena latifolia]|nr:hypothetical protein FB451DRAFT_1179098 [Mycena latifolia]
MRHHGRRVHRSALPRAVRVRRRRSTVQGAGGAREGLERAQRVREGGLIGGDVSQYGYVRRRREKRGRERNTKIRRKRCERRAGMKRWGRGMRTMHAKDKGENGRRERGGVEIHVRTCGGAKSIGHPSAACQREGGDDAGMHRNGKRGGCAGTGGEERSGGDAKTGEMRTEGGRDADTDRGDKARGKQRGRNAKERGEKDAYRRTSGARVCPCWVWAGDARLVRDLRETVGVAPQRRPQPLPSSPALLDVLPSCFSILPGAGCGASRYLDGALKRGLENHEWRQRHEADSSSKIFKFKVMVVGKKEALGRGRFDAIARQSTEAITKVPGGEVRTSELRSEFPDSEPSECDPSVIDGFLGNRKPRGQVFFALYKFRSGGTRRSQTANKRANGPDILGTIQNDGATPPFQGDGKSVGRPIKTDDAERQALASLTPFSANYSLWNDQFFTVRALDVRVTHCGDSV